MRQATEIARDIQQNTQGFYDNKISFSEFDKRQYALWAEAENGNMKEAVTRILFPGR